MRQAVGDWFRNNAKRVALLAIATGATIGAYFTAKAALVGFAPYFNGQTDTIPIAIFETNAQPLAPPTLRYIDVHDSQTVILSLSQSGAAPMGRIVLWSPAFSSCTSPTPDVRVSGSEAKISWSVTVPPKTRAVAVSCIPASHAKPIETPTEKLAEFELSHVTVPKELPASDVEVPSAYLCLPDRLKGLPVFPDYGNDHMLSRKMHLMPNIRN